MVGSAVTVDTITVVHAACRISGSAHSSTALPRHTPDTVAVPVTCAQDVIPPSLSPPTEIGPVPPCRVCSTHGDGYDRVLLVAAW